MLLSPLRPSQRQHGVITRVARVACAAVPALVLFAACSCESLAARRGTAPLQRWPEKHEIRGRCPRTFKEMPALHRRVLYKSSVMSHVIMTLAQAYIACCFNCFDSHPQSWSLPAVLHCGVT